jgi:CheY-like chemotaxis protein
MYTVLVIEDDQDVLLLLEMILQRCGCQTMRARNGVDGLNLFYEYLPHIAIIDDTLPGMSGADVCMTIRNDEQVAHIPLIICSAQVDAQNAGFAARYRADAALAKPFQQKDVQGVLSRLLEANFG